jgi:hypothetical protein
MMEMRCASLSLQNVAPPKLEEPPDEDEFGSFVGGYNNSGWMR